MLLAQKFKTFDGASKRARFENAHCDKRYTYTPIKQDDGTYRLERKTRTLADKLAADYKAKHGWDGDCGGNVG